MRLFFLYPNTNRTFVNKCPFNSRLSKDKLVENGFKPLPDWKDAVKRYLKALVEN